MRTLNLHEDALEREDLIRKYLNRTLDPASLEAFEAHYLECETCFEELRTTDTMTSALLEHAMNRRLVGDVVVLEFSAPAELIRASPTTRLLRGILHQGDSRVVVDLSRVSRIDSAGLGELMSCYSHVLRNRGMMKIVRPSPKVREVMHITRLDTVVETFEDEAQAVRSFAPGPS